MQAEKDTEGDARVRTEDGELGEACENVCSESSYHELYSSDTAQFVTENDGPFDHHDVEDPNINVGIKFQNIDCFRDALRQHAIRKEFSMKYLRSEPSRVTAKCADPDCPWRIHASVMHDKVTFQIKTHNPTHTCSSMNRRGTSMASAEWISNKIVDWLRHEGDIPISHIKKRLQRTYGLDNVPYHRYWRGKDKGNFKIWGSYEDLYALVPSMRAELLKRNKDSIIHYTVDDVDHSFQRFFVCFKASSSGFINGCRPFIGLDGCHLKSKYLGSLLAATAMDGNSGLFPVAYAIVEGENSSSWQWFLEYLHEAIGNVNGLVFMSDRGKGLDDAVKIVFPQAEHRACMRHLYKNFKRKYPGEFLERLVWSAARAYTPQWHAEFMRQIEVVSKEALNYLLAEKDHCWSRAMFGETARCHYLTNNMSESFNAFVGDARFKPIIYCIDAIRQKLMKIMHNRRIKAQQWTG
ncbi:hypothetical protein QJS04_geneDACA013777 [Acorus gramineus]|uniref:Transposase n=1 Tax=Acorus gramineus TaxID=55184 RepID=A0AAV9AXQ8_ACOGR|nr:hypothetical protein QJS04_geneDACA013777 [Acorus gramineus]